MHFRYAALLVVTTFLVSISAALEVQGSNLTTSGLLKVSNTASSRFLRTQTKVNSNGEERVGGSVSSVEKAKSLLMSSTVSEKTLQRWLKRGKSADNAFARLKLTDAKDNLFDNPQFAVWVKYVDDYYAGSLVSNIIAAQKVPSTETLATQLQTKQLTYWLRNEKTPADIYKLLMLDKAEDKVFESPQFTTWLSYLDDFNVNDPLNTQTRISILRKHYGDEALSTLLLETKKVQSTANIATKLQTEQIQRWFATETPPTIVFKYLMLNKAGDKLFENAQFSTWIKYVDGFNKKNPYNKSPLVSALKMHYNNEELAKMIEAARKIPGSEKIMKRLETEKNWLTKDTPDVMFKRLNLDAVGENLLNSPQLKTWTNYMKDYNKDNPKYQTTLIATLVKHYGDKNVIKMLDTAKNVKSTASIAKRLQAEQFQLWLKKLWTPSFIFKLMNLDETGDKLLSSPAFATWRKYFNAFNAENPRKKTTLMASIRAGGYSDKRVVQLLEAAKKVPSTEALAAKLNSELVQYWLVVKRYPTSVFSVLSLDNAGDKLLTNPRFTAWIQYSDDFNRKFPDEEIPMMKTLREHYNDKTLAKMVEAVRKESSTDNVAIRVEGKLRSWLIERGTPTNIFAKLHLNSAEDTLFTNPLMNLWTQYVEYKKQGTHVESSMIATLRKYYSEQKLLEMLETAKKNPSTEKLASDLQRALLKNELR